MAQSMRSACNTSLTLRQTVPVYKYTHDALNAEVYAVIPTLTMQGFSVADFLESIQQQSDAEAEQKHKAT